MNFPLSTYSVFAKKNVSQEHKNIWRESRSTAACPHIRTNPRRLGLLLVLLQRFAQLVFTCSLSFHRPQNGSYRERRAISGGLNQQRDHGECQNNKRQSDEAGRGRGNRPKGGAGGLHRRPL